MKRNYILFYAPEIVGSVIGVFTSGKKLADAAATLSGQVRAQCLVKTVPVDQLHINSGVGHDYQGTRLSEFLACPIAQDDTGA
jgi:hypothetical protein